MKLDTAEAMRQLRALAAEGKHAGVETGDGLKDAEKSAFSLGGAIGQIVTHQGYQMLRDVGQVINQNFEATARHVKEVTQEFLSLQESLRIIATFKGDKLTDASTVASAQAGAAAGLTPTQFKAFEEQFFGFAGQFIGDDGKKFSKAQGAEMEKRAAAFMGARGIDASQGGAIFGELLQQAKPGTSTDDVMQKFGQSYAMLEGAKGDPGPLMGQMGQVTAEGVDTTTAAKIMRTMAQRDPGEAGTYSRALLRGLRGLSKDQKRQMGITDGMDTFQQVEAVRKAMEGSGQNEAEFLEARFHDQREFGAINAAIEFGSRGGLFKAADDDAKDVTGTSDVAAVQEFKEGEAGRRIYHRAEEAAARVTTGAEFADVEDLKVQARTKLEASGRFRDTSPLAFLGDTFRGLQPGAPEVQQQLVNEEAYQMAREQSGSGRGLAGAFKVGGEEQAVVDKLILEELRKANEQREAQARKPLTAPPPSPATR